MTRLKHIVKIILFCFVTNNGEEKIIINDIEYTIPKLPYEFISSEHNKLFINGLLKSKYFIS